MGRLISVQHANNNDKELLSYSYDDYGFLENKKFDSICGISYTYSIQDQMLSSISSNSTGFDQRLVYSNDGNIDSSVISYKRPQTSSISYKYAYDNVNRLTGITSSDSKYNSLYRYDKIGRFSYKKEGNSTIEHYSYFDKTNRIKSAKTNNNDYIYDVQGNLVVDKQKKMVVRYSLDKKPIVFRFFKDIPSTISASTNGTYQINDTGFTGDIYSYMEKISSSDLNYRAISAVTMLYDASGNRVLKLESLQ